MIIMINKQNNHNDHWQFILLYKNVNNKLVTKFNSNIHLQNVLICMYIFKYWYRSSS